MRDTAPFALAARLVVASAAVVSAPALAHASPQDLFGFGPRSSAMGGTGATYSDDFGAVHANPATLSLARERTFSLGLVGGEYNLSVSRGSDPAAPFRVEPLRATVIGLVVPLPFGGVLRDRIALGVGFYTPTAVVVRGRILEPARPQFLVIADRGQSVAVQLGLGVALPWGFRVGVGFGALAAIVGSVIVAQDPTGRVGSRVDDQLVASYGVIAGLSWERGPFRLGVVFRDTLAARFSVSIEARDIGIQLPVFNIAGIAQYDPRQVAFEAGYVQRGWTAAIAGTYKRWSEYPGPLEATTSNSPLPPSTNFHDTLVVRAGLEHRWRFGDAAVALRGGYFFEPTPAPAATGVANYLDNDRHVATAGLALAGRVRGTTLGMDAFAQVHSLVARTSTKSDGVAASNPGAPSLTAGGTLTFFGVTGSVTF